MTSTAGQLAEPLDLRQRGPALWLTLNRPAARNGLNAELIAAIGNALDTAESDPDTAAVVIDSAGTVFCAGADLKFIAALADGPAEQAAGTLREFLSKAGAVFDRIEAFDKPVIAAVDGLAVAGGLELVLVCDFVIATQRARFGDAHANYGLLPGGGSSVRLPRRVGPSLAKYLMFTGRDLPAADLAYTDLVTILVGSDESLSDVVATTVADIATKSPKGIQMMKQLVHTGLETPPAQALAAELDALAHHTATTDFAEGLRAFREKRRPVFTGR